MALYHYPGWLKKVNQALGQLTHHTLSAEDFDYPWIEAFMSGDEPENAAKAALADDGFTPAPPQVRVVENLPAPAMLMAESKQAILNALTAIKDVHERMAACVQLYQAGQMTDEQLWRLLGNESGPFSTVHAAEIYERLGFVPFAGFPLVKKKQELAE